MFRDDTIQSAIAHVIGARFCVVNVKLEEAMPHRSEREERKIAKTEIGFMDPGELDLVQVRYPSL